MNDTRRWMRVAAVLGASAMTIGNGAQAQGKAAFGPSNPFYAPSTLPFQAPPFDRIKDSDYQPAIEAGMAQQRHEIDAIANDPAAPTFENTIVAMERSGQLLNRVMLVFGGITSGEQQPHASEGPGERSRGPRCSKRLRQPQSEALRPRAGPLRQARHPRPRRRIHAPARVGLPADGQSRRQAQRSRQDQAQEAQRRRLRPGDSLHQQAARRHQGRGLHHHRHIEARRPKPRPASGRLRRRQGPQGPRLRPPPAEHHAAARSRPDDRPQRTPGALRALVDPHRTRRRRRHPRHHRPHRADPRAKSRSARLPQLRLLGAHRPDGQDARKPPSTS